jgi:hypothetical protein
MIETLHLKARLRVGIVTIHEADVTTAVITVVEAVGGVSIIEVDNLIDTDMNDILMMIRMEKIRLLL